MEVLPAVVPLNRLSCQVSDGQTDLQMPATVSSQSSQFRDEPASGQPSEAYATLQAHASTGSQSNQSADTHAVQRISDAGAALQMLSAACRQSDQLPGTPHARHQLSERDADLQTLASAHSQQPALHAPQQLRGLARSLTSFAASPVAIHASMHLSDARCTELSYSYSQGTERRYQNVLCNALKSDALLPPLADLDDSMCQDLMDTSGMLTRPLKPSSSPVTEPMVTFPSNSVMSSLVVPPSRITRILPTHSFVRNPYAMSTPPRCLPRTHVQVNSAPTSHPRPFSFSSSRATLGVPSWSGQQPLPVNHLLSNRDPRARQGQQPPGSTPAMPLPSRYTASRSLNLDAFT